MFFDNLCKVAERHRMDELLPFLRDAKLFHIPIRAHEVLAKEYSREEVESMRGQFFLPFRVCAVEDTASCIVLIDEEEDQVGFAAPRRFVEFLPLTDQNVTEFRESSRMERDPFMQWAQAQGNVVTVNFGFVEDVQPAETGYIMAGTLFWTVTLQGDRVLMSMTGKQLEKQIPGATRPALENVVTAFEEVLYFNSPDRFVLETTPKKVWEYNGKMKTKQRVARSHQRPLYTVLKPREIREAMRLPEPEVKSGKRPHERRAHWRTYRSDRYTTSKGRTVRIKSTWIGPKESVVAGKRYKVLVDL